MADSWEKKQREKKKRKKKEQKQENKERRQASEGKSTDEYAYVDADGNITSVKPLPPTKKDDDDN